MYSSDSSLGALLGKNAAQTRYILCEELTGRLGGERFLIDQLQLLELQMEYRTTLSFEGKAAWFCLFYFLLRGDNMSTHWHAYGQKGSRNGRIKEREHNCSYTVKPRREKNQRRTLLPTAISKCTTSVYLPTTDHSISLFTHGLFRQRSSGCWSHP